MINDLISRKWLMECVDEGWIKFDTEKDKNTYIHLIRDIAPSAQPETHDKRTETHECDYISRQAAIDEIKALYEWHDIVTEDRAIDHFKRLPSAQRNACEYWDDESNFCALHRPSAQRKGKWIDVDALCEKMYHEAFETDSDEQIWDSGCWIRYKMFERIVNSMPTVVISDREDE